MLTTEMQPLERSELGRGRYLALQVHHGLFEGFGRSSLVVTQNGHRSVGTVVGEDLCWDVVIRCEGQESGEQVRSPGRGATASVPQPLQNQPSPPLSSLNTATPTTVPSLATSIPALNSWMFLITTDTTSTQQRRSTARAGDSRTTLPRTLLAFKGPIRPLGKAAKCKAALLTGVVHEQPRNMGLLHMHLPCLSSTAN